jgi:hypothetical protein
MAQVPTGSTFAVASTIAASKAITAITNSSSGGEAVVTCTAHGYTAGDILLITSGWGRLNRRAVRVKAPITTDSFALEGVDTSNTTFYPAGTGTGTAAKVTAWTQITTVMNPTSSGGEPKNVQYQFIDSDVEYSINDGFTAVAYTIELDADATASAGYVALKALTEVQTDTILRITTRSGSPNYIPCTVALNENVQMTSGQINRVTCAFNGNNRNTRFAS